MTDPCGLTANLPDSQPIRDQKVENDKFNAWRTEVKASMPHLANRVFALRSRFYNGCGFHYSLEAELGYVLNRLNLFNGEVNWYSGKEGIINQSILRVRYEGLVENITEAEKSADEIVLNSKLGLEQ